MTPDYRLRPEHDINEVFEDVRAFRKSVETGEAQKVLGETLPGLELVVNNLLVGGDSAGGSIAIQTALRDLTSLSVKVLYVQYAALDLVSFLHVPETLEPGLGHIASYTASYPYSLVEEHLAASNPQRIFTRVKFATRMPLFRALIQASRFCDISGEHTWFDPMTCLDSAGKMPPILLCHSKDDEEVSISLE